MRSLSRTTFSVTPFREQRLLLLRVFVETKSDNVGAAAHSREYRLLSKRIHGESEFDDVGAAAHSREYRLLSKRIHGESEFDGSDCQKQRQVNFASSLKKLRSK